MVAIGNDTGVKTIVRIGIHPDVLARIVEKTQEIRGREQAAHRIRETVEPLMSQLKRLNPGQREKATELLAQADEISQDIEQLKAEQRKLFQRSNPGEEPAVQIESKLYGGTILYFNDLECRVDHELRGPVLIRLSSVNGQTAVVATNTFTHTENILASKKSPPR